MSNKKKLIITIASMCLVLVVGVVGIFAATTQNFSISSSASYTTKNIGGSATISITGGATTNNGATAATANTRNGSFNATTTSGTSLAITGDSRYFSHSVTGGDTITITATITITNSSEAKTRCSFAVTPETNPTNVTLSTTATLKVGTGSASAYTSGTPTAFTAGSSHVYTITATAHINDFAFSVSSFNFVLTVTAEGVAS